jgi:hypothetical protein
MQWVVVGFVALAGALSILLMYLRYASFRDEIERDASWQRMTRERI